MYVRNNAEVSQENFFNATLDEVITDAVSRNASKADVTDLGTIVNQEVINEGVKKSSLGIPHNTDL